MPKFHGSSVLLFLVVAAFVIGSAMPIAQGQTLASSASLSGTVSDPSGARVANASVTVTSVEKGITRTFKANDQGNFSFALLPAGAYVLTVEAVGFQTFKQQGITLEVGQSANQNISLSIGSSEQVVVTEAAPLLQTDNANVGTEVSTKQVTELPLNLRNVFNFVELNSSVNNLSQRQTISSGGQQGSSLTLGAVILERRHSSWTALGMRVRAGVGLSTFHHLTMCKNSRSNRIRSPRNMAGALEM